MRALRPDPRRPRRRHRNRRRAARAPPSRPQLRELPRHGPRPPHDRLGRLAALWPIPALVAPLRWLAARASDDRTAASADYYPDADAVLRDLQRADSASLDAPGRLVDLKAHAYAWWHRLQGSDVATSAQLAAGAGGGGRIATLGAIVGICLSGLGAGTVCVVSGVIDNPFAPGQPRDRAEAPRGPKRTKSPHPRPPAPIVTATAVPTAVPTVAPTPTHRSPRPAADLKPKRPTTPRTHEDPLPAAAAARASQDFTFEQSAPSAPSSPAPAPVTGGGEFAP